MTSVLVEIRGTDLPGRRCGPNLQGRMCENVHVGLWNRAGPVELVPGDASTAQWAFEITVRRDESGALDFGGSRLGDGRAGARERRSPRVHPRSDRRARLAALRERASARRHWTAEPISR